MDEPTEGLAPVIVEQVEEMLVRLGEDGDMAVLVIEQNIGVATAVSENVAIMVNGRINRIIDSARLAADRDLQQRLLGVGLHSDLERRSSKHGPARTAAGGAPQPHAEQGAGADLHLQSRRCRRAGRSRCRSRASRPPRAPSRPASTRLEEVARQRREPATTQTSGPPVVLVAGTLDTKGAELRFIRDIIARQRPAHPAGRSLDQRQAFDRDVSAQEIALNHGRGGSGVFSADRGASVTAMADAFASWLRRQGDIAGIISAGGSGGTSLVAPGMRALPVGVPKVMVSIVASGDVGPYVGPADIMMMYSVTDVQGLNSISRAGARQRRPRAGRHGQGASRRARSRAARRGRRPAGDRHHHVRRHDALRASGSRPTLRDEFECLVFHATGIGGRSMEKLVDSGLLAGVIDLTTTEVCDLLMGGVFPATDDRFGAIIRSRVPYVGSVGALDMVNFGAPDTVPERYRQRKLHVHNPQVTLMRTTPEENERIGDGSASGSTRWTVRCASSCPKAASPRSTRRASRSRTRRRRRAVPRARADRAPDRQPPAHPRQAATSTIPRSPPRLSARSVPCSGAPARGGEW